MTRAFDVASGLPWAIHEPALRTVLEIADRAPVGEANLQEWKGLMQPGQPAALALRLGQPLREDSAAWRRDGVAVIPLSGPVFRYANLFTMLSGATALSDVALDLGAALADPQVRAIVLEIDSPGGEVTGIAEFAASVRAANARKPVAAYVGGLGASAAYWIAASAPRVMVARTAMLGSIGVVTTIVQRDEPAGVKRTEIVSSQSPDKRLDVGTETGRAKVQTLVDRLAGEFIAAVAEYRGTTAEAVAERFGRGGLLVGSDAVEAGMADAVGSLESLIAELAAAGTARPTQITGAAAPGASAIQEDPVTQTQNQTQPPAGEAASSAAEQAVAAERARVLGIQQHTLAGHEALAATAIQAGTTLAEFLTQQTQAEQRNRAQALAALQADGGGAAPKPGAPAGAAAGADADAPLDERIKAQWEADPKLRAEFAGQFDHWKAFATAEAAGQVKIKRG